ncbi:MAG: MFS transporter [Aeriscardovia sp.]|nr:MFS transporter [Aeriscardovia sp.]
MFREKEKGPVKTGALAALLAIYLLGNLMLQAFNLSYSDIGRDLGAGKMADFLSVIPGIVLAVLSLLYDALCDFVSARAIAFVGASFLIAGSLLGIFLHSFWGILAARILQQSGSQAAGSVFLVSCVKRLPPKRKTFYIGLFGAVYSAASVLGVLAGGLVDSVPWNLLFILPLFSLPFLPFLSSLPSGAKGGEKKVDYFGMILFSLLAGSISVFFDFLSLTSALVLIGLLLGFAVYALLNKNCFLPRKFLKNRGFMSAISVIIVFNLFSYAQIPIYQLIGKDVYHIPLEEVSWALAAVYALTALIGAFSGKLVSWLGHYKTVLFSALAMVLGLGLSALFIGFNFWLLTVFACIYNFGEIAAYSPLYSAATSALLPEERGRGMGLCELSLNTTSAIGLSVYSALLSSPLLSRLRLTASSSGFLASNVLWIMALASALAAVLIALFSKSLKNGDSASFRH